MRSSMTAALMLAASVPARVGRGLDRWVRHTRATGSFNTGKRRDMPLRTRAIRPAQGGDDIGGRSDADELPPGDDQDTTFRRIRRPATSSGSSLRGPELLAGVAVGAHIARPSG